MHKLREIYQSLKSIMNAKQKRQFVILCILSVIGSALQMCGIAVIVPFVQVLLQPEKLQSITLLTGILNALGMNSPMSGVIFLGMCIIAAFVVKNLYLVAFSYLRIRYENAFQRQLSVRLVQSYLRRPYSFFLNNNTSTMMRGVSSDVMGVYNIMLSVLNIITNVVMAFPVLVFACVADIGMAICVVCIGAVCMFVLIFGLRKRLKAAGMEQQKYEDICCRHAMQAFNGMKEIMVMDRRAYFEQHYEQAYSKRQKASIAQRMADETPRALMEAMFVAGMLAFVCFRIVSGVDASAFVPTIAALGVAMVQLLPSISRVSSALGTITYYYPTLKSVCENMQEVYSFEEKNKGKDYAISAKKTDVTLNFQHELTVENAHWHYTNSEKEVLDGLNLSVQKNSAVAFIGTSGAGKSTLADTILGLLNPQAGAVKVDGTDIRKNPAAWCSMIGYVPQSVYLIDDTIRRNVAFGVDDDKIDDDIVWRALEQAQLKDFVESLPDGLDTMTGERGARISGGQRQRIAIARALYNNPQILILDEATSALDNETESAIMESIDALHGNITLLIVAHRLTTIRNCDHIYEIGGGVAKERSKAELF